jgi:hypothetical protein
MKIKFRLILASLCVFATDYTFATDLQNFENEAFAKKTIISELKTWPVEQILHTKPIPREVFVRLQDMRVARGMKKINATLEENGINPITIEDILWNYVSHKGKYHKEVRYWAYKTGMISAFKRALSGIKKPDSKIRKNTNLDKEKLMAREGLSVLDGILKDSLKIPESKQQGQYTDLNTVRLYHGKK